MTVDDTAPVLIARDQAVATVTLNRGDRRNALTVELKRALVEALDAVSADGDVRAVVLTGAGPAFCVGQDLGEHAAALEADPATAFDTVAQHYSPIVTALATMPKPVVAAVNGTCVGAGLGFALACDLRVFAAGATLGTAFSGIGLTCDSGLSSTLPRAVGEARARELVLLGRNFTPEEAVPWGISGEIVPADEVQAAATRTAVRLAAGPTLAYAESKRLLAVGLDRPLADMLGEEAVAQARCGMTQDHIGAVTAFLNRERPTFAGE
ncbi:enoyl-CoA hydratase/isomerase family protein [Nocardioides bizhenqiangii]|uniref:Enoyl-CoA hydratase-related protein n=1 Tax=Nocardioides bizhenqiangii TaxID=3095076 RepID=A0ABZ0ZTD5_9ACTN|nr:enoyl-CoA hydratase-related protein [Nocardioides sp. HM61]WQQ27581.1 enoyl-CoA hydratase-related protein [Nocardioides sp. HM61]